MSKTEKFQFIREFALEVCKQYKGEGYDLTPAQSLLIAREAIDEMEEDFEC